jgi:hypothetical protein
MPILTTALSGASDPLRIAIEEPGAMARSIGRMISGSGTR